MLSLLYTAELLLQNFIYKPASEISKDCEHRPLWLISHKRARGIYFLMGEEKKSFSRHVCEEQPLWLEILYNKEICHLQLKNADLYVCPASFIKSRVNDWLIL